MKIYITHSSECIDDIVDVHMAAFKNFFLTSLGRGFLRNMYMGYFECDSSGLIVAESGEELLGFCAFSQDASAYYKYLIKHRLFQIGWYAVGAFIRKPSIFFRLLRAFLYPKESKRTEKYVHLSSIAIRLDAWGNGIGSMLLQELIHQYSGLEYSYIQLETDRLNNDAANRIYIKNGFVLDHSYTTHEGREMNEYRYYLSDKVKGDTVQFAATP